MRKGIEQQFFIAADRGIQLTIKSPWSVQLRRKAVSINNIKNPHAQGCSQQIKSKTNAKSLSVFGLATCLIIF
jgi:hypothetical protein